MDGRAFPLRAQSRAEPPQDKGGEQHAYEHHHVDVSNPADVAKRDGPGKMNTVSRSKITKNIATR